MLNNKNLKDAIISYNSMQSFLDEAEKMKFWNVDDRGKIPTYQKLADKHKAAFEKSMKNFIKEVIDERDSKES